MTAPETRADLTVEELLTTTRAVRRRLDLTRAVPRQMLLDCIEIATQAPTGRSLQLWRWVVVDDPDRKAAVAEIYRRCYTADIADHRAAAEARGDRHVARIIESGDHLAGVLADVPALVIPCMLGRPPAGGEPGPLSEFYGSIMPAVWSFMLAARRRGLGTSLTTVHLHAETEVAGLLGIPDTVTQIALIPVAYHTGDTFRAVARKPPEDITFFNDWHRRSATT